VGQTATVASQLIFN